MAWWYGFPYKLTCVATHLPRRLCTNYLCQLSTKSIQYFPTIVIQIAHYFAITFADMHVFMINYLQFHS